MDAPNSPSDRLDWLLRTSDVDTYAAWWAADHADRPDDLVAALAYAEALGYQGQYDAKLTRLQAAQARWPNHTMLNISLGLEHLSRGDYSQGWSFYEHRRKLRDGGAGRPQLPPERRWRGEPIVGKHILITQEQGLGDSIHFARAAIDLQRAGARPLVDVQGPLRSVFAASPALGHILQGGATVTPSLWMGMLDAVPLLSPNLKDVRWPGAYIAAAVGPPLLPRAPGLRVGLCWSGSSSFAMNDFRSMPLAALAPLADVPGCRFYSLMMPPGADQISEAGFQNWLTDLSPLTQPFDQLASVVSQLDVVVTVCTSIAHLAGAMGKPVFLMLSSIGEWRWARDTDTTPWYPSMRLFRQRKFGAWSEVAQDVAQALTKL